MDISKASNFERFIFDLLGRDSSTLTNYWEQIDQGASFILEKGIINKIDDFGFVSSSSKHVNRMALIKEFYEEYKVLVDTHTADGIKAAIDHFSKDRKMLVLETALPIKFEESVFEATGIYPERPSALIDIESLNQKFVVFENDVAVVKDYILAKK